MVTRVALALIALLVIAWSAVLLRDYRTGSEPAGRSLLVEDVSAAQRADDRRRLDDAQLLDPSSYWALALAANLIRAGKSEAAARAAERLVRDEPESTNAWKALRAATQEIDPRRSAQAQARLRELDPQGAG